MPVEAFRARSITDRGFNFHIKHLQKKMKFFKTYWPLLCLLALTLAVGILYSVSGNHSKDSQRLYNWRHFWKTELFGIPMSYDSPARIRLEAEMREILVTRLPYTEQLVASGRSLRELLAIALATDSINSLLPVQMHNEVVLNDVIYQVTERDSPTVVQLQFSRIQNTFWCDTSTVKITVHLGPRPTANTSTGILKDWQHDVIFTNGPDSIATSPFSPLIGLWKK